jgi:hypothetical protein
MNYTQKNNLQIIEIKITYSNSTTEESIQIPPSSWRHFPGWTVEAYFQRYPWIEVPPPATPFPHDPSKNYWIIDYYVKIQADTGQVIEYNPFMSA